MRGAGTPTALLRPGPFQRAVRGLQCPTTTDRLVRTPRDGTRLIWSPRSNISLYGVTAGVQIFHRLGGVIALGTDWSYSGSATVPRELAWSCWLRSSWSRRVPARRARSRSPVA